jgi:CheY-like chemotaxis protein
VTRREKRILVVDDDAAIRALLLIVLRRRGFHVDTARNGAEAVDRCARCTYSVILLDLMMPVMSGYEFLEWLRRDGRAERPLVIVLTAGTSLHRLDPSLVTGPVRKPFDIDMLADTVTIWINTVADRNQLENCPPSESEQRIRDGSSGKPN